MTEKGKQTKEYHKHLENLVSESSVKLKESEDKYWSVLEQSADCIYLFDIETKKILESNTTLKNLLGYSSGEMKNLTVFDFISHSKDDINKQINLTLKEKKLFIGDRKYIRKDGSLVDVEVSTNIIKHANKKILCVVSRDITERKIKEKELELQKTYFEHLFEVSPEAIAILDLDDRIIEVNKEFCNVFEFSENEVIGEKINNLLVPSDLAEEGEKNTELVSKGKNVLLETTRQTKSGKLINVLIIGKPIKLRKNQVAVYVIYHNITERKKSEKKIHHLNTMLYSIRKINQLITKENNKNLLLKKACNILNEDRGYSSVWIGLIDKNKKFKHFIEVGLGEDFVPLKEMLIQNKIDEIECVRRALEQTEVIIIDDHISVCKQCPLLGKAKSEKELTIRLEYGDKIYGILSVSLPVELVTDKEEQMLFHELANDISFALHSIEIEEKRKHAEEALKLKTIELQERNKDLDSFAHTVAHDLKNPLGTVIGFADLMKEEFYTLSEEDIQEFIQIIVQSSSKMQHIIDELLLLSSLRKSEIKTNAIDMNEIIVEAKERLLQMISDKNAKIILPNKLPKAIGYKSWIEEVWVNYMSNAIKYGGSPPKIEFGWDKKSNHKGMLRFWIRDNGNGISHENQERLFEKYERLDQLKIEGSGLGLSIVRGIMEKLGGDVGIESEIGKGSLFYFILPDAESNSK